MSSTPRPVESAGAGASDPAALEKRLIQASRDGDAPALTALLDAGANPNAVNKSGYSALLIAAHYGHEEIVRILLSHPKIDPNFQNAKGATALHFAAQAGHLGIVQALLAHPDIDPTLRSQEDISALNLASNKGHFEIVAAIESKLTEEEEEDDLKNPGNLPFSYHSSIIELSKALGLNTDEGGICFGFAVQTALSELATEPNPGILPLIHRLSLLPTTASKKETENPYSAFRTQIQALADEIQGIPMTDLGSRIISTTDPDYERKKELADLEQWLINLNFIHQVHTEKTEKIMPKSQTKQTQVLKKELLSLFLPSSIHPEAFNVSKMRLRIFNHPEALEAWLQECERQIFLLKPNEQKPISFLFAINDHAMSIHFNPLTKNWTINDAGIGILHRSQEQRAQIALTIRQILCPDLPETYAEVSGMGEFPLGFLEAINDARHDYIPRDIPGEMRGMLIASAVEKNDASMLKKFITDSDPALLDEALAFAKKNGHSQSIVTILAELIAREGHRTLGDLLSSKIEDAETEKNAIFLKRITDPYREILKSAESPEAKADLQKSFPEPIQKFLEQRLFLEKIGSLESTEINPDTIHKMAEILLKTERIFEKLTALRTEFEAHEDEKLSPMHYKVSTPFHTGVGVGESKGPDLSGTHEDSRPDSP